MKFLKTASVVLATLITLLAFFFFKPPVEYFGAICVSTVLVWGTIFSVQPANRVALAALIVAGMVAQLGVQHFARAAWMEQDFALGWPLAQFVALQYVVVLRLLEERR